MPFLPNTILTNSKKAIATNPFNSGQTTVITYMSFCNAGSESCVISLYLVKHSDAYNPTLLRKEPLSTDGSVFKFETPYELYEGFSIHARTNVANIVSVVINGYSKSNS